MLSSLIALAQAGEILQVWEPALTQEGQFASDAMVVTDLDGDGLLDYGAALQLNDGTLGFVSRYGSDDTDHEQFLDVVVGANLWRFSDFDGDGAQELVIVYPELLNGEYTVIEGESLRSPPDEWSILMDGKGRQGEDGFGTDLELVDLDGDGVDELVFGAPQKSTILVIAYKRGATIGSDGGIGSWVGGDNITLGSQLTVVQDLGDDGHPDIVAATGSGIVLLHSNDAVGVTQVGEATVAVDVAGELEKLVTIPDMDGDGFEDIAWVTSEQMSWLSLETGEFASWPVSLTGDVVGTADGVWISDGAELVFYDSSGPVETFALEGTLGSVLQRAGDLDGDGCEEVHASHPGRSHVLTLSRTCVSDTGDTGEPEDDTGPQDDTGQDDTGVCVPVFGWGCSSTPGAGGFVGGLLFLLGLGRWLGRR